MSRCLALLMWCVVLGVGCAAPIQRSGSPSVTIDVFRKDAKSGGLSPLLSTDVLGARQEAVLDIRVDRPSYVTAVLYAAAGISQALTNVGNALLPANQSLRVSVPRNAPPGVKESELPIVLAVSATPTAPMIKQLLRLPCSDGGGRGDPEPTKDGKDSSSGSSTSGGDTGKPPARESRGGNPILGPCMNSAEWSDSVTVRTLVLRSE
jgi:hypothetical protein